MSARFPREIREQAIDKFLDGMQYKHICDWLEASHGQRPAVSTVMYWVRGRRQGRNPIAHQGLHAPETVAEAVAQRVTSTRSFTVIGDEVGVAGVSVRKWTQQYWPDPEEAAAAASLPFDEVYAITMERVSKDRRIKRTKHQRRIADKHNASPRPAPVDSWLPGPGPVPDMDALPDDPAELKKLLAQERERQAVKDAIIEVLMGSDDHTWGSGDAAGKALVRDGALSTAAKAAAVCTLTDTHKISIAKACALAGIAQSTFYHHQGKHQRSVAKRKARRDKYKVLIRQAVDECGQSYGYRRIHAWLVRGGHRISEKIVRELMDALGCHPPAKASTKYSSYTGETAHRPANLLLIDSDEHTGDTTHKIPRPEVAHSQYFTRYAHSKGLTHDFHADQPWQKIGTDVSEIRCSDGRLYLSAAIDFFDGMPIAVTMSQTPNHELVAGMIERIDAVKPADAQPILHSDRGGLYRSTRWVNLITDHAHNITGCKACATGEWCQRRWRYIPSLSRKGTSGDNARTEGFFGTMKQELLKGRPATKKMTVAQMRDYIDNYIDFYTHTRLKSTLGNGYATIAEHRQALGV